MKTHSLANLALIVTLAGLTPIAALGDELRIDPVPGPDAGHPDLLALPGASRESASILGRALEHDETFKISTASDCIQRAAEVASQPGGGFITIWEGNGDGPETFRSKVLSRLYDATGEPRTGEFQVNQVAAASSLNPDVAVDAEGNFVVVWESLAPSRVAARRFDPDGEALTPELVIDSGDAGSPAVAAFPDGSFAVVWQRALDLVGRWFEPDGTPSGPIFAVAAGSEASSILVRAPTLTVDGHDRLLVVWNRNVFQPTLGPPRLMDSGVFMRWFDREGNPLGAVFRVDTPNPTSRSAVDRLAVAAETTGRSLVTWTRIDLTPGSISEAVLARLVFPAGPPPGAEIPIAFNDEISPASESDVTAHPEGGFTVVWSEPPDGETSNPGIHARTFNSQAVPLGPGLRLQSTATYQTFAPAVAAGADGGLAVVWEDSFPNSLADPPGCNSAGIFGRITDRELLVGDALLLAGRFRVDVDWQSPKHGTSGAGEPTPITGDTGAFWFFEPDNLELVTKMIDGRSVNGHFWFFYGALSNVGYQIRVTDIETGAERGYDNPAGTLASFADTAAFPVAAGAQAPEPFSGSAFGDRSPAGPPGASSFESPCSPPFPGVPLPKRPGLCLNDRRFEVEVTWIDPFHGGSVAGIDVPLTDDTGAFWFFRPDNLELMVKVLDARSINGHFWVFYGALTNVGYTVTVRDTASSEERVYENAPFEFRSLADTAAFPVEP